MTANPVAATCVDDTVIAAAIAGDPIAFGQIYRVYQPKVAGYVAVRTIGWSHHAREDIVSEVFLRALKNIGRYRHDRDIGAWLCTIARNLVYDAYKSRAHQRRSGLPVEACAETVDDSLSPDETAAQAHLARVLRHVVNGLPQTQFDVIALRFYAGLSVAETAACLGLDEGAVKARQSRACRVLAKRDDVAALIHIE